MNATLALSNIGYNLGIPTRKGLFVWTRWSSELCVNYRNNCSERDSNSQLFGAAVTAAALTSRPSVQTTSVQYFFRTGINNTHDLNWEMICTYLYTRFQNTNILFYYKIYILLAKSASRRYSAIVLRNSQRLKARSTLLFYVKIKKYIYKTLSCILI